MAWEKKLARVQFRARPDQRQRWERAAARIDRTPSRFIALACDHACLPEAAVPTRKRGRMRAPDNTRTASMSIRAGLDERTRWKAASADARRTLTDWLCRACDAFVGKARTLYAPVAKPKRKNPRR